jgi:ketosteroid isomerase-like protein
MTTQTQLEVAEAFIEAFRSGGVEELLQYATSDVEIHSAPGWAGKPLYLGHDGGRELAAEWTESFQEYGWKPATYEEVDGRRVLAFFGHHGRTREGIPIDGPLAALLELDGDKVGTVRFFFTWDEARAAV